MGQLTVVGLGPGEKSARTLAVQKALEEAEWIIGYAAYIRPLREEFPDKEMEAGRMTEETDRCRLALSRAAAGIRTVLVSSGDAGVYGMASPVLELAPEFPDVSVRILPGVTAALSGGALLGAPLGSDFAVISLSDRLTPWETIERRLRLVSMADMPIALYNPGSHARTGCLKRACQILLEQLPETTPCGLARLIGRGEESAEILTLGRLAVRDADMFTTVFIGNHTTKVTGGRLVTPRGYDQKPGWNEPPVSQSTHSSQQ